MEQGYTRTVITTTVNRTYHELRTQRMQDYGQPSGTLGINCRHDFYPFSEDINTNNQHSTVTPKEAIRMLVCNRNNDSTSDLLDMLRNAYRK